MLPGFYTVNKKNFVILSKVFGSYRPSSIIEWKLVIQLYNCFYEKQSVTIQQTEKKKKCMSLKGVCIMSLIGQSDTISK